MDVYSPTHNRESSDVKNAEKAIDRILNSSQDYHKNNDLRNDVDYQSR